MACIMKCRSLIAGVLLLLMVITALAQTQSPGETLSVQGYAGQASVIRSQGRLLVDAQDLARITNGSLSFEKNRITLTLPPPDASKPVSDDADTSGFSRPFMKAAIEAMASIREWGGMLMVTVEDGYPVGLTMAGNTIMAYQERAADNIALASAAASTNSDRRGLELLRSEFSNVQVWADKFVNARSSLSAANVAMSEGGVKNDPEAQKIIQCGQFLAQMFAGGTFQDDAVCH